MLAAIPVLLDAGVTLAAKLAVLSGSLNATPFWLVLLDAALVGLMVPVGFFLVVCGILLAVLASRPPRPRVFRAALGGAGTSLAAGLGTLVAFCGIAASLRDERALRLETTGIRIRPARGKSIYPRAPSAR